MILTGQTGILGEKLVPMELLFHHGQVFSIYLNYIHTSNSYRAVNTQCMGHKTNQSMLYSETVVVFLKSLQTT